MPNFNNKFSFVENSANNELIKINSLGFRDEEFTIKKPADVYRLIVLGDSFTFGQGVSNNETYSHYMEEFLNQKPTARNYQVINAGFSFGHSPDSYYAFMMQKGLDYSPDMVIIGYFIRNDFTDLFETHWTEVQDDLPVKVQSRFRMVDLHGTYRLKSELFRYKIPLLRNSHLFQLLADRLNLDRHYFRLYHKILNILDIPVFENFRANPVFAYSSIYKNRYNPQLLEKFNLSMRMLEATDDLCQKHGIKFMVVVIPTGVQTNRETWEKKFTNKIQYPEKLDQVYPQKRIIKFLTDKKIEFLDLLPYFRKFNKKAYFLGDGHWNPTGNAHAARIIVDYLLGKKMAEER